VVDWFGLLQTDLPPVTPGAALLVIVGGPNSSTASRAKTTLTQQIGTAAGGSGRPRCLVAQQGSRGVWPADMQSFSELAFTYDRYGLAAKTMAARP
jgi:hypothetical protein